MRYLAAGAGIWFSLFACHPAWAQQVKSGSAPEGDLTQLSIESLMNIEVTSASKKEEKISQTAAAIYVITQEDIRRSGLTSIAELLRMVPGLEVARINANQWAISSRGFNDRYANKLLVLIDGRSVYTPLDSGVEWDVQDTLLADIERIEVIRGPGASLWGANAVNGVINIITKHAKDTQGGLLSGGTGNEERGMSGARYGGRISGRGYYRFFGKYFNRGEFADEAGRDSVDNWEVQRGGFRTDWSSVRGDSFTVQGDYYNGSAGESVSRSVAVQPPFDGFFDDRVHMTGGNILGRWKRIASERSKSTLQFYYDRTYRSQTLLSEGRHTLDVDFQHDVSVGRRQEIVWGGGYRFITDQTVARLTVSFHPSGRSASVYNAFVQDEIALLPERLRLTVGLKMEHNDYAGFAIQPNIRLLWAVSPKQALWGGISRAVRSPSRTDSDLLVKVAAFPAPDGTTTQIILFGNPRLKAENVVASELGYRAQLTKGLSLDLTTFYNSYDQLRSIEPGTPFIDAYPSSHLVIPLYFQNALRGETHGIEAATIWKVTNAWKVSGSYTWFHEKLHSLAAGGNADAEANAAQNPRQQWSIRSYWDLPRHFEFDAAVYYVSSLSNPSVREHTRLDSRLGWRPREDLAFSVAGQNLLGPRHYEFDSGSGITDETQVKRSVYAKVTWRF